MKTLIGLLALLLAFSAHAEPFAAGNVQKGKALVNKQCVACHVSMFGGDGSGVYTRADHKVKNAQQLAARISACNNNTGAGWFPEDELNAAAYLNQTYYHFK
jgi:mono/diheme cytochrome c family protein